MYPEQDNGTKSAGYISPGPHVVTPDRARKGSELLAEAEAAKGQSLALGDQISGLEKLREQLWEVHHQKRREAGKVLMGPDARVY
jgi:hypothetical protein